MSRWKNVVAIASICALALVVSSTEAQAWRGKRCCPPPPEVAVELCVAPPCSCCPQNVTVCVPCCCTEAPCVSWRNGLFGRQIGTYSWACCGHSVKVIVNSCGEVVKVRD